MSGDTFQLLEHVSQDISILCFYFHVLINLTFFIDLWHKLRNKSPAYGHELTDAQNGVSMKKILIALILVVGSVTAIVGLSAVSDKVIPNAHACGGVNC